MKRIALFAFGVLAMSSSAWAQSPDIDTPVLALPANLREGAGVVKWKPRPHVRHVEEIDERPGLLRPLGLPAAGGVLDGVHRRGQTPRVKQNMEAEALGDKMKSEAKLMEQEKAGTRVKPVFGSVWYHLMGPSKEMARTHMTIAVPGATTATMGLPDNGRQGGVWIMNAGTTTAHLMTPGE